ncbi:unnamed protein product [Brassica rapa]|uniref:indole-3-pyruvate monooxygenase n=1 Tax=Brassica campestris TaxID=3711 RepID=A0A3P5YPK5_BRACM|nr:unnamed protein product [Brassica rapa]VDC65075.1 unnamed protein product [Brassica rapa]
MWELSERFPNLDGQLRIPESCHRKSFGSYHTDNWSSSDCTGGMNNLTNENIKPFTARRYRTTFSSVATTRNSDHCHKLWKLNWSEFVVVAAGENGERYTPVVKELYSFTGQIVHSSQYKCGHDFKGKNAPLAGGGNLDELFY